VKPAPFDYIAPRSLDEALGVLASSGGDAKILAGGQSLLPLLNMRLASPRRLVDLNRVPELAYIHEHDGGYAIGAMTRDSAVERDPSITRAVPLLAEAIGYVGHAAIRNRGTIGGSIAHADPSAELPAVALCLDARLTIQGPRGARTIGANDLFLGYLATSLEPDELLTEVWFPKAAPNTGRAWLEFARRHGDYAIVGIGVTLTTEREAISEARIVATGVGGMPVRATAAETILAGSPPEPARTQAAIDALRGAIEPDTDVHATAAYRRHLAGVLLDRALTLAYARAQDSAARRES
jgi:carbon-monoxide dehydrogenase medium subunit